MATYKTRGIVLGRHNLGEADRIVAFLTVDHGKLRAVAKGVRKTLAKAAGHIEPFSEVDLMLAEGRNLDILTSARLVWYPASLTGDYDRLKAAFLFVRMIERLTDDRQVQAGLYRLLRYSLDWLDREGSGTVLELFFKLRLLSQLGYRPQLEHCSSCGRPLDKIYLSPSHGGAVCSRCQSQDDEAATAEQLGLWRRLISDGLEATAPGDEERALATIRICDTFYEYIFGRSFAAA